MTALEIIFYVFAIISFVIALLLSGHGNTGGITPMSGNDIELFKKTKDRGIVKIMQFILFVLILVLIVIGLVIHFTSGGAAASSSTTTS